MAFVGVVEEREGFRITVKLHGPAIPKIDEIQFKNLVKALVNKHTTVPNIAKTTYDLCKALAQEIINVYGNHSVLWAECITETSRGYLAGAAAERADL